MDHKLRDLTVSLEKCFLKLTNTYERQPEETSNRRLKQLGKRYGIKIITSDTESTTDIKYDAPTKSQVLASAEALEKHLSIYPIEIIQNSRIEQITLTRNLQIENIYKKVSKVAGLALTGYDVVDTLFIEAKSIVPTNWHGNRLFHHELYHAIDYRDSWFGRVDSKWRDLQGTNFKYGIEILNEYLNTMKQGLNPNINLEDYDITGFDAKPSKDAGFVSDYSRLSYVEDKAEIYASLITDYESLMNRTKKDLPLKRKVKQMKTLLAKFSSCYNDDFWKQRANENWRNK